MRSYRTFFNTRFFAALIPIITLGSCHDSPNKSCSHFYEKGKYALDNFYLTNDSAQLSVALKMSNSAITCTETKKSGTGLKISALAALGMIDSALRVIDSVDETHFFYPYQKKSLGHSIRAWQAELEEDSIGAKEHSRQAASHIQHYVDSVGPENVDDMVLMELFTTRSKFQSEESILREIDTLSIQYPGRKTVFEKLKEVFRPFE